VQRGREMRGGAPAEVAARDREGRGTPRSEKSSEEDDKFFGPIGREGKFFLEKRRVERDDWLGGNSEGRMTCEDEGKSWRVVEGPWEGRTQRDN
jgi:hypothetical protein